MIAGGSISHAAVFRTIDMIKGTLVFDEADFRSSEIWSEIVKILNSGHTKGFPVVRMEKNKGDKFDPTTFEVFGPKILASRERFVDEALESRCLTQYLLPLKHNTAPTHLPKEFEQEALDLRNKLLMFRFKNLGHIPIDETTVKDSGILRLKQSALALTCVAKAIDENILTKVTEFLKDYENELQAQQVNDVKADVLICILGCLKKNKTEKIRIGEIAKEFEDRFKEHYSDIQTEKYDYDSKMFFSNHDIRISPKRVGSVVRKLGIGLRRDGHGFYIPIPEEQRRIQLLAERYGIDQYPESN